MTSEGDPQLPILRKIALASAVASACMIGVMALVVVYEVAARFAGRPTSWAHEIIVYLLIWSALLSFSLTQYRGDHFRVTILIDRLPPAWRRRMELFGTAAAAVFCVLMLWRGLEMTYIDFYQGRVTPTLLHIPMGIIRAALPLGALLLFAQLLGRIYLLAVGSRGLKS
jgi:C4-dicarboxylate transporter, DctQ subunit